MMFSMKNTFEMLKTGSISSRWLKPLKTSRTKTALGVDISDKQISLALLKGGKNGVELLASASAPVPDGAIKNGNIENATALANAIKSLKKKSKIKTTRAVVSLFTEPSIMQIMGVPKQVPTNIGQFVQGQVKHFAVLPANNIALDFCGVAGAGSETGSAGRLLVAASDGRKVDETVKVFRRAGLTVEAIEPLLLAYTRALYAKKIAGKFDYNVLIAVLQNKSLTLCVFKKQAMDFIRTKIISREKFRTDELPQWLAEQINDVIQFYDVDVPNSCGKWEIAVVADRAQLPQNAEEVLKAKVTNSNLQLLTSEDICRAAVVSQPADATKSELSDKPSPVAIGLAMRLLGINMGTLGVNLLPPDIVRLRAAQKGALITANIVAALLLITMLAVNGPIWKIEKLNESINYKTANLLYDTRTLIKERASVDKQIDAVSNKLNQIKDVLGSHQDTAWAGLIRDIGKAIPRTVCITSLSSGADSKMFLKGLATSNEAVYWFVDRLNKSDHISSASISEAKRDSRGLINYEVNCALAPGKGK